MGYLRRLLLVNSGGYPFADIRLDGHCDMAGGQGVGKTTMMNAILFPFVVEDQYLDIDRNEKTRFSLYYFPNVNSFVIYEAVNNRDIPYTILINRNGQALSFHFINAPFDLDWLYDGEQQVKGWSEIKKKLSALGIQTKTEETMWRFNSVFLGKGEYYNEQYSIVRTPKDRDAVRPLLSAIFRNRPFTQDALKESLVSAVMSSNQMDSEGIDLTSHKNNLKDFTWRYSDIRKMSVPTRGGKTAVQPIADEIFSLADAYYESKERRSEIPSLLKFSLSATETKASSLEALVKELSTRKKEADEAWSLEEKNLDDDLSSVNMKMGEVNLILSEIRECEEKYKDIDITELVQWRRDRKVHRLEKESLEKRRDALTADSREISAQMETELSKLHEMYRFMENKERDRHNKMNAKFQSSVSNILNETKRQREEVISEYDELLEGSPEESGKVLLDKLSDTAMALSAASTIEEIRLAVEENGPLPQLSSVLEEVLSRRNPSNGSISSLEVSLSEVKAAILEEINRRTLLEKEKSSRLAAIESSGTERTSRINDLVKEEENAFRSRLQEIKDEHDSKAEEMKKDYEAKIHGNDSALKETLEDIDDRLESENYILEMVEKYPSAEEDKAKYLDRKGEVLERRDSLNLERISVLDNRKNGKEAYKALSGSLTSRMDQAAAELRICREDIRAAEAFLSSRKDVAAAFSDASPLENDRRVTDIKNEYEDLCRRMEELREDLPQSVKKLYRDGMLSRVDTFQIGIGYNDSLSSFEDFLSVAEKLRTRLENAEQTMGMDKYIRLNTEIWLGEIRDISAAMSPAENMLLQIQSLCRKANAFMKEHNTTDCIDSFLMNVDENNTTDLVKLLREISSFYQEKNLVLGTENLFFSEDDAANRKAVDLLSKLSTELDSCGQGRISISSMFDIRMDIVEKGNLIKNVLSFNNPGSKGTAVVLKAMLNMTLLHLFLEKRQAQNTRLICAIDEMNTIEARNLDALTEFASKAGLYIIGSGQHHTKSALDYSYNVWDEPSGNGERNKYISMDAVLEGE